MSEPCYFSDWPASTLELRGADRIKIVQNLSTADLTKLAIGQACETFITNIKGHIAAHAIVCLADDVLTLVLLAAEGETIAAHFEKYIFREDAQVSVGSIRPLLMVGSRGADEHAGVYCCSLAADSLIDLTADVERAQQQGYQEAKAQQLDQVRVANLWPLAGVDFAEGALPQELDRNELAISFTKGCYLGQETIARLDALGHVNKQIVRVTGAVELDLPVGTELTDDGKTVGKVTTTARWEDRVAGIAMVRRGSNSAGTSLETASGSVLVEHLA